MSGALIGIMFTVASSLGVVTNEVQMPQMPLGGATSAFIDQLPEEAVVPADGARKPRTPAKPNRKVAQRPSPAISVSYPNVGSGVNAALQDGPALTLPSVGSGLQVKD